MSQPGVFDVEFVWPSTIGIVIYDSTKTNVDSIMTVSKEKSKREISIISDQEFK